MKSIFQPKLVECLRNYTKAQFSRDAMAGVIVGIIAIPMAIAFGIASGVGPTEGLVTAIIAGFIISALGGSKVQVGGPTGAFIIIIYGIIQQFGLAGLMIATVMAGIMLVLMGVFKLGSVIKFVPYPVIIGFTGGIAITIFSTQMNDFFGMGLKDVPADFIEKWMFYFQNLSAISWESLLVGAISLLIIIIMPRLSKVVPGSLVAIVLATLGVWVLNKFGLFSSVTTIGDLYELPNGIPVPSLPALNLKEGETVWTTIQMLLPAAFTIAMLGAIESLLSAMVADGSISDKHNSNTELIAQGAANIVVPFFGGIPATGAIARTMANINNGGATPVAGIVHAVVLLMVLLFMGSLVGFIPMPCLAAVLIIVAYNMSGWRTFVSLYKGPKSDFVVLIVTFILTVIFDLTFAIQIGLLLAVLLFMKRVSESVNIRQFKDKLDPSTESDMQLNDAALDIPAGVDVYEIDGPYFFGIANKFEEVVARTGENPKVRIIRMRRVPFMDSSGINNLQSLCLAAQKSGTSIVLSGVNDDVRNVLKQSGFNEIVEECNVCSTINLAIERAKQILS